MKTVEKTLLTLTCIFMLAGCSKDESLLSPPPPQPFVNHDGPTFTSTFKAVFNSSGTNLTVIDQAVCGPTYSHIVEDAKGSGTFLGNAMLHADFCTNLYDIKEGYIYITAEDGDVLYVSYHGQTCYGSPTSGDDWHGHTEICCWQVPFTILGGTGRFEGATGGGTTDDFLDDRGEVFRHTWKGTITLITANQKENNY